VNLVQLGWQPFFQEQFEKLADRRLVPARIASEWGGRYLAWGEAGQWEAVLPGRFRVKIASRSELPVVGDWVAVSVRPEERKAVIQAVLPRRSRFSRKAAGDAVEEQVVAANVDTVFLVSGLDAEFNVRRIERYVALAADSGAQAVIVLNKMDLCPEVSARVAEVQAVVPRLPVVPVSATQRRGLEALEPYLASGHTVALLGSSGVGKSTLVNVWLGEVRQPVAPVRDKDARGRHATSRRELLPLPGGAWVIDTPGLRELHLWGDPAALQEAFADVEALVLGCRFRNCQHGTEPGCAVQEALREGRLDPGRWRNYLKLQEELRYLTLRQDQRARLADQGRGKKLDSRPPRLRKRGP